MTVSHSSRVVTGSRDTSAGAFKHKGFVMKNVRKMMLRAGLTAMALGMAGSAQAAQYLFTAGGTVYDSSVAGGLFGATGNNLNGARFSVSVIFDDATPGLILDDPGSLVSLNLFGFGASNPTTGTITVNGISFNTLSNGTGVGAVGLVNGSVRDAIFVGTGSQESSGTIATDFFSRSVSFRGGLNTTNTSMINSIRLANLPGFSYAPTPGETNRGNSVIQVSEVAVHNGQVTRDASFYGNLTFDSFAVSLVGSPGAVPEPASWALMIAGFGLVGSAMRRKAARVAYA